MGSPVIGKLHINGRPIFSTRFFGGPFFVRADHLLIPEFIASSDNTFRLVQIDLPTLELWPISKAGAGFLCIQEPTDSGVLVQFGPRQMCYPRFPIHAGDSPTLVFEEPDRSISGRLVAWCRRWRS